MSKEVSKNIKLLWLFLILGIIMIITGIVLSTVYYNHEVIDKTHVIKQVNNHISRKEKLEKGEVVITKDVKHISKGVFKITYKNNYRLIDNSTPLFENNSLFTITDILGDSFEIVDNLVTVNGNTVKVGNSKVVTAEYDILYKNNKFEISFPSKLLTDEKVVEINVRLIDKTSKIRHYISKDSYYSLIPNKDNNYYLKKTMQSYVIYDDSYIILKDI